MDIEKKIWISLGAIAAVFAIKFWEAVLYIAAFLLGLLLLCIIIFLAAMAIVVLILYLIWDMQELDWQKVSTVHEAVISAQRPSKSRIAYPLWRKRLSCQKKSSQQASMKRKQRQRAQEQ